MRCVLRLHSWLRRSLSSTIFCTVCTSTRPEIAPSFASSAAASRGQRRVEAYSCSLSLNRSRTTAKDGAADLHLQLLFGRQTWSVSVSGLRCALTKRSLHTSSILCAAPVTVTLISWCRRAVSSSSCATSLLASAPKPAAAGVADRYGSTCGVGAGVYGDGDGLGAANGLGVAETGWPYWLSCGAAACAAGREYTASWFCWSCGCETAGDAVASGTGWPNWLSTVGAVAATGTG